MRRALLVLLALLALGAPARAVQPDEVLGDPALEARARALSTGLRCLVCQNQSIDDSDAPLARDLRLVLRARLDAGDTDGQARDYLVARYGEFVLLRPVLGWHTALLWLMPLLVVAGGGLALLIARRRTPTAAPALSEAERHALAALLAQGPAEGPTEGPGERNPRASPRRSAPVQEP